MRTLNAKENVMRKTFKMIGIIAIIAIIGLAVTACGGGGGKLSGSFEMDDRPGFFRTFAGDKYTFEGPGFKSEGTFTVSGDELTITSGGDVTVFKFKLSGNKLQLANAKANLNDPNQWQNLTKK